MIAPEDPPGFVVRTEVQKVTWDIGFRIERGAEAGWLRYGSTTARGDVWIAGASPRGPWLLSVGHPGVAAELASDGAAIEGPGVASWEFSTLAGLYNAVSRAYQLGVSLPDAPLETFRDRAAGLSRGTEAERLVVQRIGQDIFRKSLLEYWKHRCPLTGVADPALLRASHIVPWAECDGDAHRLDVYNGLLLSALWDAAFDAGKVSFSDEGDPLFHAELGETEHNLLRANAAPRLVGLTAKHAANLARHRQRAGL